MPTYDFKCKTCGYEFEQILAITATEAEYPKCEKVDCSGQTEKIIKTAPGVQFKGADWPQRDIKSRPKS